MLGEKLKTIRVSKNMSQVELAKHLNITKQSVSNWENNNILPSIEMIKKLSMKLSITSDYLLELDNRYILDVTGLPVEIISTFQDLINDYKSLINQGKL